MRNTNDLSQGLGRILRDNEAYYLLAYEPANAARDGKFRKIEVRLRARPGLRVRTRSGYFAPDDRKATAKGESPEALREREIGQALGSLFPLEGVPMRMSADFIDLPPAGPQAVIRTQLDVSGVPFVPAGDRYAADLEIAGAVYDDGPPRRRGHGRAGPAEPDRGDVSEGDDRRAHRPEDRRPLARTLPGPHGRPRRDTVAPRQRERVGRHPGRRGRAELTLSSVFLLADAGAGATDLTDVQVDRRFRPGQGLHYVVHAYDLPAAGGATLQAQVWQGGRLVGVAPKHAIAPASGEPAAKWSERIALDAFAPGDYVLRVLVTAGSAKAQRQVSFRVE